MYPISDWYSSLGNYTFPTVFVRLQDHEIAALCAGTLQGGAVEAVERRLDHVIQALPGNSFAHADCCAPTDSALFVKNAGAVKSGRVAWQTLVESAKVREAFAAGQTQRIGLHPYRRMDNVREFRMFFRGRQLRGMSQLNLERHFGRLEGRKEEVWAGGVSLAAEIAPWLPAADICVDVYLTSKSELMIVDMNPFGLPTKPLLFRSWDFDWDTEPRLRLIPKPMRLQGDVEVSF